MRTTNNNINIDLDILEEILSLKVSIYKKERRLTEIACYKNMLELLQLAKRGDTTHLKLLLESIKIIKNS